MPPNGQIVAHVNPTSPGIGLAFGQDRHGGVIAVQSFSREDMRFNTPEDRFQHRAAGPDLVGQGRQAQRHAFLGVAFGLAVERLMLPELLEQDHREQAGTGPASGDHMERRRRLADLLAIPASELLAHVLDHLPLARNRFQRLGDGLAQLAQPAAAAAQASCRSRYDHPLTRQMLRERLARGTLAGKGRHRSWSWPQPSRRRSRPRWPNSPVPRTATRSDRAAVTCVPSAAHRAARVSFSIRSC